MNTLLTQSVIEIELQRRFSDYPGVKHLSFAHARDIDGHVVMRVAAQSDKRIGFSICRLNESDFALSLDQFIERHLIPAAKQALSEMEV